VTARAFAAGLAALAFAGAALAQGTAEVRIKDYKFVPEKISVKAGTTVKWVNDEKRASHSVWFKDERLAEGERLFQGDSWERKFDKPGTYRYTCGPHPEMHGVVEVTP
jgi:plastocyanin